VLTGSHFGLAIVLAASLGMTTAGAQAVDDASYPRFNAQWSRATGGAQWDPTKRAGLAQQPPLTPEYQAIFEANIAALAAGSEGYNAQAFCVPSGMPRMMIAYEPMEIIVTPEITYVRIDHLSEFRRIYTDGRGWPEEIARSFDGYSIGKWEDEDGDGRYDALAVETRNLKGPRNFDANGIPLHTDNRTIIKERLFLDKVNADVLYDEITTIDNALTRPWTVTRSYRRVAKPVWLEYVCTEDNHHIVIGDESYFLSSDGYLMPTRKDQPPPDLRHFGQARK
jgi:hypothetical protein